LEGVLVVSEIGERMEGVAERETEKKKRQERACHV